MLPCAPLILNVSAASNIQEMEKCNTIKIDLIVGKSWIVLCYMRMSRKPIMGGFHMAEGILGSLEFDEFLFIKAK